MDYENYILQLRTSTSFRGYVIFINILTTITIFTSILAIKNLLVKKLFNKPTNHLIISNIVCQNIHNFSYSYIEVNREHKFVGSKEARE
ncbi:unnamed protein product [Caenorhabditis angaria]|uniref:Uncharacterized protein n=1 Tax=Caenorhabditis angaria TaxID=860376 RepID=A0A9P1MXM8_9PELO|nr:unnamed protein product [Caenorhabditis angaria]